MLYFRLQGPALLVMTCFDDRLLKQGGGMERAADRRMSVRLVARVRLSRPASHTRLVKDLAMLSVGMNGISARAMRFVAQVRWAPEVGLRAQAPGRTTFTLRYERRADGL
mmetsp:Transcript_23556/g.53355  ORF Transcript_23556/g.53355 Transcript_23556/m.53355 type:complete len:110 (+) Transcript_23556:206-535(+)